MRSVFQINLVTGKVETNRWYFKKRSSNRKLSGDDKQACKAARSVGNIKKGFSALSSNVGIPIKGSLSPHIIQQAQSFFFFVLLCFLFHFPICWCQEGLKRQLSL